MKAIRSVLAGASLALGCSGPDPGTLAATGPELTSRSGSLLVTISSTPESVPVRGVNQLEFAFLGMADGLPVDGLEVTMVPFMPAMGHGSSERPSATALGNGTYRFERVVLSMAGLWELRTTVAGARSDFVVPRFDVE